MKITSKFKSQLYSYFIKRLGAFEYKHGWLRVPTCPYCNRENKMGVNLSMYRCNCFRCNEHPSPAQMVMDIENLETYSELIKYLSNGNFNELEFKEEKVELQGKQTIYLPEGFRNIRFGTSQLALGMQRYVRRRGFQLDRLSRLGIG